MMEVIASVGIALFLAMLEIIRRLIRDKFELYGEKLDDHIEEDKGIQDKIDKKLEKVSENTQYILGKFNGHCIRNGKFVKEK